VSDSFNVPGYKMADMVAMSSAVYNPGASHVLQLHLSTSHQSLGLAYKLFWIEDCG
jgi:hypothetical protein